MADDKDNLRAYVVGIMTHVATREEKTAPNVAKVCTYREKCPNRSDIKFKNYGQFLWKYNSYHESFVKISLIASI